MIFAWVGSYLHHAREEVPLMHMEPLGKTLKAGRAAGPLAVTLSPMLLEFLGVPSLCFLTLL